MSVHNGYISRKLNDAYTWLVYKGNVQTINGKNNIEFCLNFSRFQNWIVWTKRESVEGFVFAGTLRLNPTIDVSLVAISIFGVG